MAYPDPADFLSGQPLSAWWLVGAGEGRTYGYATQGETSNKRIQRELNTYFQGRLSPPLEVDGVLGQRTLERLRSAALEHSREDSAGGYTQIAETIARDIRARTISNLTYRWGLWLAYVRPDPTLAGRGYGDVVIAAGARLPTYGQSPDDDRDAGGADLMAVRWLINVQPAPTPPPRSDQRVPLGSNAPTPGTSQSTTTGASTGSSSTTGGAMQTVQPGATATRPGEVSMLETEYMGVEGKYWLAGGVALGAAYMFANAKGGRRRKGKKKRKGKGKKS